MVLVCGALESEVSKPLLNHNANRCSWCRWIGGAVCATVPGMCGVCGIIGDGNTETCEMRVRGMMEKLIRRGPDGEGLLSQSHAVLGMRRLSIIDLQRGDQPVYNEAGDVAVVFNGEIYNFIELCQLLLSRGHRFRTRSDTEVIV